LTTFLSYGEVASQRQADILRDLSKPEMLARSDALEMAQELVKKLSGGDD
jgi:hypothetical protein